MLKDFTEKFILYTYKVNERYFDSDLVKMTSSLTSLVRRKIGVVARLSSTLASIRRDTDRKLNISNFQNFMTFFLVYIIFIGMRLI